MCSDVAASQITVAGLGPDDALGEADRKGESAFAVELGRAEGDKSGLTGVPFLRSDGQESRAGLLLGELGQEGASARELDLGRVVGAAGPPRLALGPEAMYVALEEGDASGGAYRLGRIERSAVATEPNVRWFSSVDADSDDSRAFDDAVESRTGQLYLAHDSWDRESHKGQIWIERVGAERVSRSLGSGSWDAESPALASGAGALWLGYATVETPAPERSEHAAPAVSRRLRVVRVGDDGQPEGEAIALPTGGESVQSFDLSAGHDGSLIVAWRAHSGPSGAAGGLVGLTRVGADGSVEEFSLATPAPTAGALGLLFDPDPRDRGPHGWVFAEGESGETQLAALSPEGRPLEPLSGDAALGGAVLLTAHQGKLLVARSRGRAAVLELMRCIDTEAPSEPAAVLDAGSH